MANLMKAAWQSCYEPVFVDSFSLSGHRHFLAEDLAFDMLLLALTGKPASSCFVLRSLTVWIHWSLSLKYV